MDSIGPGAQLLGLLDPSPLRLVIVAPFIKLGALKRVLDSIDPLSVQVDCVTRWLPTDIADGVCDLEILDALTALPTATLWLRDDLHAKYYRADDRCLVGSANLTGKACAWRLPPNLELMVELPASFDGLEAWETALLKSCRVATETIRDELATTVQELLLSRPARPLPDVETDAHPDDSWMPLCSRPDLLFDVYRGRETAETMVTSAFELAQRDLAALAPPPDLSEALFKLHMANALSHLRVIREVMDATTQGVPDSEGVKIIQPYNDPEEGIEADDAWGILKEWIMHFFPGDFRRETGEEVLVRGRSF